MISLNSFNLSRLLSQQVAPVLFRQGTTGKQRFSRPFWMCRRGDRGAQTARPAAAPYLDLFFNDYRRVVIHEIE
jgi:hypothetical protein